MLLLESILLPIARIYVVLLPRKSGRRCPSFSPWDPQRCQHITSMMSRAKEGTAPGLAIPPRLPVEYGSPGYSGRAAVGGSRSQQAMERMKSVERRERTECQDSRVFVKWFACRQTIVLNLLRKASQENEEVGSQRTASLSDRLGDEAPTCIATVLRREAVARRRWGL